MLKGCAGGAVIAGASLVLPGCAGPRRSARGPSPDRFEPTQAPAVSGAPALYRFVDRLSWGASDVELERASRLGPARYLAQQFTVAGAGGLPDAAQQQIDASGIASVSLPALIQRLEPLRQANDRQPYQQELNRLGQAAATRHLLRALHSPQQLREHMTWFWLNHFNVHMHKADLRAMVADYEDQALRPHALGRFRDLLGEVVHHPAMLRYLDNEQNAAGHLNENLARELMELHTLGVDGGYTQQDVQELARVLTGHGLAHGDQPPRVRRELQPYVVRQGLYEFHPGRHDFGSKRVLGQTIEGRGPYELSQVLDGLAAHPSTARLVTRKMAVYFLGDDPPAALLERMRRMFLHSGGHIGRTLEVLLTAPEFTAADRAPFKDPMHFVVSAMRMSFGNRVASDLRPALQWLNRLGEGLYNRQTPDGYPLGAQAWSSSGQMTSRFEVARAIGTGAPALFRRDDAPAMAPPPPSLPLPSLPPPSPPPPWPALAQSASYAQLRPLLGPDTRAALDATRSPADWNTLLLSSPEFQYR